ncbi:hypothetical protein [EBPR siphovirus 2]|nr:hypothetical protein [EBPR siphovirus 2]
MSLITPRRALIGAATAGIVLASQPSLIASPALILPSAVAEQLERRGVVEPHRRMPDIDNVMAMLMMAKMSGMLSGDSGPVALRPQDVFATSLYTGDGTSRTITTGVNMSAAGGLTWIKTRSGTEPHVLFDTVRGAGNSLTSDSTGASDNTANRLTAFGAAGFDLGTDPISAQVNGAGRTYVAWSFRRAPKFFDVVTYTGNGTSGRTIAHGLGVAPGMIAVKCTSATSDWSVYHRSNGPTGCQLWNTTNGFVSDSTQWNNTSPGSTTFTVGSGTETNQNGATYVAYLFAHDTAANGLVQCGTFGSSAVTLGWNPQFLLLKNAGSASDWYMLDTARDLSDGGFTSENALFANNSGAEQASDYARLTGGGFTAANLGFTIGVYLAIRAPV